MTLGGVGKEGVLCHPGIEQWTCVHMLPCFLASPTGVTGPGPVVLVPPGLEHGP